MVGEHGAVEPDDPVDQDGLRVGAGFGDEDGAGVADAGAGARFLVAQVILEGYFDQYPVSLVPGADCIDL